MRQDEAQQKAAATPALNFKAPREKCVRCHEKTAVKLPWKLRQFSGFTRYTRHWAGFSCVRVLPAVAASAAAAAVLGPFLFLSSSFSVPV